MGLILKAISFGVEKTKEDPFIIIGISLAVVIYWTVPFYVVRYLLGFSQVLGSLSLFLLLIINFFIAMGYIKVVMDIHDGNRVSLKDLFYHYKKITDFLIGLLFYFFSILIGFLLLVFPGIYLTIRFSFSLFLVLQGSSALESLKKSWRITKGQFFNLLFFYLIIILINIAGATFFIIGLAITLPTTAIATVYFYRELSKKYNKNLI